eukprot:TRINITY_DN12649_c0_g1_i1.p1 TRINITY_DN12649_c0_g1~~TRINITY_DN12649_c0_g1_i1.p1  ORF type:complete len:225 (+),score=14.26 TRINITY_DN12649_c0_g1_i1:44-676(+)
MAAADWGARPRTRLFGAVGRCRINGVARNSYGGRAGQPPTCVAAGLVHPPSLARPRRQRAPSTVARSFAVQAAACRAVGVASKPAGGDELAPPGWPGPTHDLDSPQSSAAQTLEDDQAQAAAASMAVSSPVARRRASTLCLFASFVAVLLAASAGPAAAGAAVAAARRRRPLPRLLSLAPGSFPEGIAAGPWPTYYVVLPRPETAKAHRG